MKILFFLFKHSHLVTETNLRFGFYCFCRAFFLGRFFICKLINTIIQKKRKLRIIFPQYVVILYLNYIRRNGYVWWYPLFCNPSFLLVFWTYKLFQSGIGLWTTKAVWQIRLIHGSSFAVTHGLYWLECQEQIRLATKTLVLPKKRHYLLTAICSAVHWSRLTDFTLLMWTPRFRCIPAQRIQKNTPKFHDAQRGPIHTKKLTLYVYFRKIKSNQQSTHLFHHNPRNTCCLHLWACC